MLAAREWDDAETVNRAWEVLAEELYQGAFVEARVLAGETLLPCRSGKAVDGLFAVFREDLLNAYAADSLVHLLSPRLRPRHFTLARRALRETPPPHWALSIAGLRPRPSDLGYIERYLLSDGSDPEAVSFLAAYGEEAVPLLERILHRSPEQSCRAARMLNRIGYTGHLEEMELYASGNLCLARALAEMAPERARPAMLAHLSSPDARVRRQGAYAAAGITDTAYLPVLLDMLSSDDTLTRLYAAFALGFLGDTSGARLLVEAAQDTTSAQGLAAERLLTELPGPLVEPVLYNLLSRDRGVAARRAAQAAGLVRDTSALPYLEALLESTDQLTQRTALDALGRMGDARARDAVRPFLESDSRLLKVGAVLAMGGLHDTAAVTRLSIMLFWEVSDFLRDGWIRHPIVDALVEIGDSACLPYLAQIIDDGDSYLAIKILRFWADKAPRCYIPYCDFFLDEYFFEPLRVEAARAIVMMSERE